MSWHRKTRPSCNLTMDDDKSGNRFARVIASLSKGDGIGTTYSAKDKPCLPAANRLVSLKTTTVCAGTASGRIIPKPAS